MKDNNIEIGVFKGAGGENFNELPRLSLDNYTIFGSYTTTLPIEL
jgi:hypothetical protein